MNHSNDSENETIHDIVHVKLEPCYKDYDCTQNLDPLESNINVHVKTELLQEVKTELQSDGDQAMNDLIQEDILANDPIDTEIKIGKQVIKAECFPDETSAFEHVLDFSKIIKDGNGPQKQLGENSSNRHIEHVNVKIHKQTDNENTSRYELSQAFQSDCCDIINEDCTNYAISLKATSFVDHSKARIDTCNSAVDILTDHKHINSEEEDQSKQIPFLLPLLHPSYECDVCNKEFKNSRNLSNHKVVHTGQKSHVCDICQKGFNHSSNLTIHKRIHTNQRTYVCDICQKGFNQSSNLAIHKRVHTNHKPYVCDVCNKEFSLSRNLTTHRLIHTGEKPHVCGICKKRFNRSSNLAIHRRTHTNQKPHVCDLCGKGFGESSNLAKHKLIHTNQKRHACDVCGKGFNKSSRLAEHKHIHTGHKPYICNICQKRFNQSSYLAKHKLTHTSRSSK